jgi:hypothetical protein
MLTGSQPARNGRLLNNFHIIPGGEKNRSGPNSVRVAKIVTKPITQEKNSATVVRTKKPRGEEGSGAYKKNKKEN